MDTVYIHRLQDMTEISNISKAIIITTANLKKKSNLYLGIKTKLTGPTVSEHQLCIKTYNNY